MALSTSAYLGLFYLPASGITVHDGSWTAGAILSYIVYDIDGNTVQTGSVSGSATTITLVSSGTWQGTQAGTIVQGFYQVQYYSGAGQTGNNVSSDTFMVATKDTTYFPDTSGLSTSFFPCGSDGYGQFIDQTLHAVIGAGWDRDAYQRDSTTSGSADASLIHTNYTFDTGSTGYLNSSIADSARPRVVMCSDNVQGSNPNSTYWSTLCGAMVTNGDTSVLIEIPSNEYDSQGASTAANLAATCVSAYNDIKGVDSSINVVGPCLSNANLDASYIAAWCQAMNTAGVKLQGFTFHMDTNAVSDMQYYRNLFTMIKNTLSSNGWSDVPVYCTELWATNSNYGIEYTREFGRYLAAYMLIWEEVFGAAGLGGKENNYIFYDTDHGYLTNGFLKNNGANNSAGNNCCKSAVLTLHVMAKALAGYPASSLTKLSTGLGANYVTVEEYSNGSGKLVVLLGNGLESTVNLTISDAGPITYWDGVGRTFSATVSGGVISVPCNDLPTYVFLSSSCTVSVSDAADGLLSTGSNLVLTGSPTITNESSASGAVAGDGVYHTGRKTGGSYISGDGAPYIDTNTSGYLTFTYGSAQTISYLAFACTPPTDGESGISANSAVAWTLERYNSGAWTQIASYSAPGSATSVPAIGNSLSDSGDDRSGWGHYGRLSFYRSVWAWAIPLGSSYTDTAFRLNITTPTWGQETSLSDSEFGYEWYNAGVGNGQVSPQEVMIREVALFAPGVSPPVTVYGLFKL